MDRGEFTFQSLNVNPAWVMWDGLPKCLHDPSSGCRWDYEAKTEFTSGCVLFPRSTSFTFTVRVMARVTGMTTSAGRSITGCF